MSNLRLLNQTVMPASVSSLTVNNMFSADYDVYKIIVTGMQTTGSTATDVDGRLVDSSGKIDSQSKYDYSFMRLLPNTNYQTDGRAVNNSAALDLVYTNKDGNSSANTTIYVFDPFASDRYTFFVKEAVVSEDDAHRGQKYIACHKVLGSYTGLNFFESNTRPFEGAKILTYGIRVD